MVISSLVIKQPPIYFVYLLQYKMEQYYESEQKFISAEI
jgi:hypothetical protein